MTDLARGEMLFELPGDESFQPYLHVLSSGDIPLSRSIV
jgi:hypothetical protein